MIKPTDVRIGNYIGFGNSICKVYEINEKCFYVLDEENTSLKSTFTDLNPIPLTESELEKLGVIKKYEENPFEEGGYTLNEDGSKYYTWVKGAFNLEINKFGEIMFEVYSHYIPVDWVHQFQNLYYLLTNEELTYIK